MPKPATRSGKHERQTRLWAAAALQRFRKLTGADDEDRW